MQNPADSYASRLAHNRFLAVFQKIRPNGLMGVTFGGLLHLPKKGCVLREQIKTQELADPPLPNHELTSEKRLSFAALMSAAIQGLCVFAVGVNSVKVVLGFTSVAAGSSSSLIHSDPVRLTLRYVSAALATATIYVIWNGWRLRSRAASQWRRVPLTKRQKWAITFGLLSAFASWFLIIAEVFAHQRMHPR